jgi:DNA-binding transcriptional LysR family regulator
MVMVIARSFLHDFVGLAPAFDDWPQVRWLHRAVGKPRYVLRASTTTTQAVACAEGLGLALLPVFTGARDSRLVQLFPRQRGPSRELFAVYHTDLRGKPRVASFLSWLDDVLHPNG